MADWLQPLLMMFYAPVRGIDAVRDRGALLLAASAGLALAAQTAYMLFIHWLSPSRLLLLSNWVMPLIQAAVWLLFTALVFVPVLTLVATLFERRGRFAVALQQEYATLCSVIFYTLAAASVVALPIAFLLKATGLLELWLGQMATLMRDMPPETKAQLAPNASMVAEGFAWLTLLPLPIFCLLAVVAVHQVFHLTSWLRAVVIVIISGFLFFISSPVFVWLFGSIWGSPVLLLLLFFLLRGYFSEIARASRARVNFKRKLELATLNPADASAHYNLGLVHLQRRELDEARRSFERAIEIDEEETDAHYQLGRISRSQNLFPEAISHFEQVVSQDQTHAQYEVWREIGATYIAAGQFNDGRDALERFLDHRRADPEGLYLMGRALAGLGHKREAIQAMEACIEAVKTAPAYKYRNEKRWLTEAEQFLRSQA